MGKTCMRPAAWAAIALAALAMTGCGHDIESGYDDGSGFRDGFIADYERACGPASPGRPGTATGAARKNRRYVTGYVDGLAAGEKACTGDTREEFVAPR